MSSPVCDVCSQPLDDEAAGVAVFDGPRKYETVAKICGLCCEHISRVWLDTRGRGKSE